MVGGASEMKTEQLRTPLTDKELKDFLEKLSKETGIPERELRHRYWKINERQRARAAVSKKDNSPYMAGNEID